MKGATIFINISSLGFIITFILEKKRIDLFIKLKHESLEFITPSNPYIFLNHKM